MSQILSTEYLTKLAAEFGTPLYVYHADRIKEQYNKLQAAFKDCNARFFYACKALSNINILKYIESIGASLDCVSINEIKLGLKAGFPPDRILFTPNCVDFDEIEEGKNEGVHINIDSISMLEKFGTRFGNSYPICIRFNPHIMGGGNYKISTGHIDSKFGISIHQLRHIERIVKSTDIWVRGIHMHTGSDIKDVNVFIQGLEVMVDLAKHFPQLEFVDLGSGFKVPYQANDVPTDIALLGQKVTEVFKQYEKENKKQIEVWFEPGKYLVSEGGYFIVKANVIKQTTATVFAGVNSGFNHLIRPMFYDSYHRIENITNHRGAERIYLPEVREGDYLVFYNAGAYCFEMSSNFNSRLKPAEVLVMDGKALLIRKREDFEDLLRNQLEVL
ncbi:MAG: diaminopimelate decarboxylase [Chitinophagaceae bacterium]